MGLSGFTTWGGPGLSELKELSLESLASLRVDTVVGAAKHEQKLRDAPANVTVLTREEVQLHGWRTLGEALRSVPGLVVTHDRSYSFLGVRGFNRPGDYSGRTLITVNGHRLNDAMFDSTSVDRDFILDIDLIERIEVIRGPGSTLYGNNAFFGIVNVVTRRGATMGGAEVSGSYGTFDTYTGRLSYGTRLTNGVEFLFSGSVYGSDGNPRLSFPEFSHLDNGIARNMDDGWSRSALGQVSWKALTLEVGYVDRFKRVPTLAYTLPESPIIFNDRRFRIYDDRAFASLKLEHTFEDDWKLMARVYYDYYRYDGYYPSDYEPDVEGNPSTVNFDLDRSQSFGGEIQVSREIYDKHLLTLGAEARYDFDLTLINRDLAPAATYLNTQQDGYFAGLFLQDEFRILPELTLTAGLRYDYYAVGGETLNPRAALIYRPWDPGTWKLLYGEAYRAPNASENYYDWPTPPSSLGLEPETVRSYEIIYEHELGRTWRASAAVFRNELKNLITDSEDGFANMETATAQGVELGLTAFYESGIQGRASYTFADAYDDSDSSRLANSPEHLGKLNIAVPIWRKKVFASAELQIMSRRKTLGGPPVNGLCLLNTTLFSRELLPGLDASVSVYNLLDTRYSDPASMEFVQRSLRQDGRQLRCKLTWRF
ncbi:MAG TPA: TonB-dependent receptor [Verrucomicrobiae bacterium]|nr:TonB-dependent receptor [Verrucomicrobiae bacterium]